MSGIATNSENFATNFTYANQNQDLNTIRVASFSTRNQSKLPEVEVAVSTELFGSVQGETASRSLEDFLMDINDGMQNEERIVERSFADGSLNHNQSISNFDNFGWEVILRHSQNQGDIEQAPAAGCLDNVELNSVFSESTDMFRETRF